MPHKIKNMIIGEARNIHDPLLFHKISLIAIFAWIGLGSDALSSSAYGPPEAFLALGSYKHLSIFIALMVATTILVISASYTQIVKLFPQGGGGYTVASKLLSPSLGRISGCALLIDYVLTITVSIASSADALFSFLPREWYQWKMLVAVVLICLLIIINLRGVRESVFSLLPVFVIFVLTHFFALAYGILKHSHQINTIPTSAMTDVHSAVANLGLLGLLFLMFRAYSMGAGTYTGIEAVSNATSVLREPKVLTARKTMRYMSWSLVLVVLGLMLCYTLFDVNPQQGKTLNTVLFESVTQGWPSFLAVAFVFITIFSEAAILFVAAQTGFLGGPRVLANMATDGWLPKRFTGLSDRLVVQNGVLIMGGISLIMMLLTGGSVKFLIVLYSISVFITFSLSQLGMVRYWWKYNASGWLKGLVFNGIGLIVSFVILISMVIFKFREGGWLTLLTLFGFILVTTRIKHHYNVSKKRLQQLDYLTKVAESEKPQPEIPITYNNERGDEYFDPYEKTAVVLVSGYNGMSIKTLSNIFKLFGDSFKNFVFVRIGVLEAGSMKDEKELEKLDCDIKCEGDKYIKFMNRFGYYAESITIVGTDVVSEVMKVAPELLARFPNSVFFGGQQVFEEEGLTTRMLHNYTVFSIQEKLFKLGVTCIVLPVNE
jgi:amino acid transporter